jgi:hypothetical protein
VTKKFMRGCGFVALLGSCGLLAASLADMGRREPNEALRSESDPVVIPGVLEVGKGYDVNVEMINPSSEPANVIGSLDHCSGSCFSARSLPALIPARGMGRINVHVDARSPGLLSDELILFTDRASQPTVTLHLKGMVWEGGVP